MTGDRTTDKAPREAPTRKAFRSGPMTWAVIGTGLAALTWFLLPALNQGRRESRQSPVQNNAKQQGLAVHNFSSQHKSFPPGALEEKRGGPDAPAPSWQTALLPFVNAGDVYDQYDFSQRYDAPANAAAVGAEVDSFLAPHKEQALPRSENGFGLSHWAGNVRVLGEDGVRTFENVQDGTVNTILIGEVGAFPRPWADPANLRDPSAGLGSSPRQFGRTYHRGKPEEQVGGIFTMVDGSVHFISDKIDPATLAALGTPDGGEVVDEPLF